MKELTNSIIKDLFQKTGVEEDFFPYYEEELKMRYKDFRESFPYDENEDEEERTEDEKLEKGCIECANDYIRYYATEREKGHSHKWSDSVARAKVSGEHEYNVYHDAFNSIENKEEREKELEIHTNSLSEAPIFRERYKYLFKEQAENPQREAEQYVKEYRNSIRKCESNN